jgi:FkbM family methyltransferase
MSVSSRSISVRGQTRPFYLRDGTSDVTVFDQVITRRQYDLRRLKRVSDLVAYLAHRKAGGKAPFILDAGANIGASAMFFADHIQDAVILALEPDAGNFALLSKNIDRRYVQPMQTALSSTGGFARIVDPGEGHWGYRTEKQDGSGIPCVTVNDIYAQAEARCFPFIVKIDIEGGEADLFSQNTEWVSRTPLLIVELHDWLLPRTGNSRHFLRCVSQLDRDFVYIGEDIYSISNSI